ncbi:hypothetical protein D1815_15900 [Aquimarina sp. AD1]|uniref:hypothetical protein n=1 Tax=Aquimarina TaxID=290174 RepID=UPI000402F467|nr:MULTISPECIES: hypothetical protein [Aquimarina]AXT57155.1 hypothetical protein D1815_15900 [Aquimarina sp. AD1]RKN37162.1 hypothetical protein D7035_01260 [Aquimarina sp. AD1]
MAKIKQIILDRIPEYVEVDDHKINNIIVNTEIEFHPLDISGNMEYLLHLFVYDMHGASDVPVLISNWDETKIVRVEQDDRKDDFLCKESVLIKCDQANKKELVIKTPMSVKLGKLQGNSSVYHRNFKVFGTLIPAVFRASKWSEAFESKLVF